MKAVKRFIAFDLGASNGRAVVGEWDDKRLACEDIYHFPNEPVAVRHDLFWDILRLYGDIKQGLVEYTRKYGPQADGIGIDTWGVDFGLLDRDGRLLGNPEHYRNRRSEGMPEHIRAQIDAFEIYTATGVQLEQISTICQLYALAKEGSPQLETAESFLMIPSLFSYFLTGNPLQEHSNISNSGVYGFEEDAPALAILDKLGIPRRIMPRVANPGTVQGPLLRSVQEECGLEDVPVIAPATHDTASAVVSVPADPSTDWAFLSCGTWSVLGIETDRPMTSGVSFECGVTNAATAGGKFMPRINITGLWIIQAIRRIMEQQGLILDWGMMVRMAEAAEPFAAFIDVDDPSFVNPPDMRRAVRDYIDRTGQIRPAGDGGLVRVVLESLALKYRNKLRVIESLTGSRKQVLHIVGGGVKNSLLCQFTADAVGIPVVAGPVEATSMGNLLVQMVGAGIFSSVSEGRQALRQSMDVVEYEPVNTDQWDEAYERYLTVLGRC